MIVNEMKQQQKMQSRDKADSPSNNHSESIDSPSKNYSESRDNTKSPSEEESESHLQSEVATKEVVTDHLQAQDVSSSASKPSAPEEMPEAVGHKLFEELKELIQRFEDKEMNINWIYFVDSGGQPQFHNIFQAFIESTSILLLVFSLAEKLSDCNKHLFQDKEGHDHSKNSDKAAPRVDVVLKSIASTLCSTVSEAERKILFVVTHRDIYEENTANYESIKIKEQQLCKIFGNGEEIQTTSTQSSTVLFPVNGLQAEDGDFDDEVVVDIRKKIFSLIKETKYHSDGLVFNLL